MPAELKLVARPTRPGDYRVLDDGDPVGRIRHAVERTPEVWVWNVQILVPIPAWCNGWAPTREAAMAQFREAWSRFKPGIGEERYARALADAAAAKARFT